MQKLFLWHSKNFERKKLNDYLILYLPSKIIIEKTKQLLLFLGLCDFKKKLLLKGLF